jgi:NADPH-dependent 2,4-dienoyl-CoA reductase/sulfur reductase-like enzyme
LDFEVLVVGSGPAGIAAAVRASENGAAVGLVDDNPAAGGQIWRDSGRGSGKAHAAHGGGEAMWRKRLAAAKIDQLHGWSVFDQAAPGTVRAQSHRGEIADLRYEKLIVATGARERFLPFPGWTLPNVMGAGALQAMVKSGLPIQGKRVVVAGSGPLLLAVAASLRAAGAVVVRVCEQASLGRLAPFALSLAAAPGKILEGLRYKAATWNVPFHASSWPLRASGDEVLRSVELSINGKTVSVECDYLACGFHLVPNIELAAMLGCRVENGTVSVDEWQRTSQPEIYCAGEPTGIGGLELSLLEGQIAGLAAVGKVGLARELFSARTKMSRFAARLGAAFALRPELRMLPQEDTLLCRCEDVPYGAVRRHQSWRSAKLHTRCGMGPCQGRVCGAATDFLLGWSADSTRPPILPVPIASLAASQPRREPDFANATTTGNHL